jgi:hypothetical protein
VIVVHHPSELNFISANSVSVLLLSSLLMLGVKSLLTTLTTPEKSGVLQITEALRVVLPLDMPGGRPAEFLAEIISSDKRQQQNNYMTQKYD